MCVSRRLLIDGVEKAVADCRVRGENRSPAGVAARALDQMQLNQEFELANHVIRFQLREVGASNLSIHWIEKNPCHAVRGHTETKETASLQQRQRRRIAD